MATLFEWNPLKAAANGRKHGVSFHTAILAFTDPHALTELERVVDDEPRWQTIGTVNGISPLLVVHTDWEEDGVEIIRIISARQATRHEKKRCERNLRESRN
jgi:uncharacterized protein